MSSPTTTFNIFCLQKNGKLLKQATIEETKDKYTITPEPLPMVVIHLDSYLRELFDQMMMFEKEYPFNHNKIYKTKRFQYLNDEFVEATIFHRAMMRKGSYFYVYQKSERGTRFLLYAMDRIHHSSIALGCCMRPPNIEEERKEMKDYLSKHMFALPQDVIQNDSLYFL